MTHFASLAVAIARQNLQERFAGSFLGTTWLFLWPLVQLLVYVLIFGQLMGGRLGPNQNTSAYGLYIAAGLLGWTFFANTVTRSCRCLLDKRGIIVKVKVNLLVFPVAICLEEFLPLGVGLGLLAVTAVALGWEAQLAWLGLALLMLYGITVLALGLGVCFGCLAAFVRDLTEAVPIALQLAFWFTPIVYVPTILPSWLASWLWLNPMTGFITVLQQCFVLGGAPRWGAITYALVCAHGALALGFYCWRRLNRDIRDVL